MPNFCRDAKSFVLTYRYACKKKDVSSPEQVLQLQQRQFVLRRIQYSVLPDLLQGHLQKIVEGVRQALFRVARQGLGMPSRVEFLSSRGIIVRIVFAIKCVARTTGNHPTKYDELFAEITCRRRWSIRGSTAGWRELATHRTKACCNSVTSPCTACWCRIVSAVCGSSPVKSAWRIRSGV